MIIGHPVSDVDLEAMAQPGSEWLTDGPVRGSGPATLTVSLAPVHGIEGMLHAAFLCLDTAGRPVTASYTWQYKYGDVISTSGDLACDPGPDTANTTDTQCDGGSCVGRTVQTFSAANSAGAVMPQIEVPRGASWVLFAWLAPLSIQPGAGVSAKDARLRQFTGYGLSFTYPQSWHSQTPGQVDPTTPVTLVFESTAPMHDACPITTSPSGASGGYPCGLAPVAVLPRDGVLVDWSWTEPGSPPTVGGEYGRPRTVAGHPAWLFSGSAAANDLAVGTSPNILVDQQNGPSCRDLRADWVVSATISASPYSSYQMLACIRGPDTGQAIRQVLAMVNSVSLGQNPGRSPAHPS